MEDHWLAAAKRLNALAETGLHFTSAEYDRERYAEIREIALTLLASLADAGPEAIANLLDPASKGYATPLLDVRAAVFHNEQILLVREKVDGLWTLPGGFADVGLSARENVEKEMREEAGISVRATRLYAIRHKAKGEYRPDTRDFYKLFFLCEPEPGFELRAGSEVSDAAFFAADALPPLSTGRVVESDLRAAWDAHAAPDRPAHFD